MLRNNNLDININSSDNNSYNNNIINTNNTNNSTSSINYFNSSVGGKGGASTGKQTSNIRLARASRGRGTRGFLKLVISEQYAIRNLIILYLQLIVVVVVILLW